MQFFIRNFSLLLAVFSSIIFSSCAQSYPKKISPELHNITSILSPNGVTELSGLHYNPQKRMLYAVSDDGNVFLLKYIPSQSKFSLQGKASKIGGPEGVMQVDYSKNEFFTIDEKNYKIFRFSHNDDMSSVSIIHSWNLLLDKSNMINTDNDGPEGIEFIPDTYLKSVGFISNETDEKYLSKKGMGGLIFIAHQKKGFVWVYDVNPEKDDDYVFVGKYKTSKNESCDLAFDRSTGLLYILHNTDNNSLEVTDLRLEGHPGKYKFSSIKEYPVPSPKGNKNFEGVAVTPKFPDEKNSSIWFCRDVSDNDPVKESEKCLFWINPVLLEGNSVKGFKIK